MSVVESVQIPESMVNELNLPVAECAVPVIESWPLIKVYGMDFREDLMDMYSVVEKLKLWDWFRNESPPEDSGYMYWGHENIKKIQNEINDYNGHSGSTFAFALRCMQSIAKKGFDKFCIDYNASH